MHYLSRRDTEQQRQALITLGQAQTAVNKKQLLRLHRGPSIRSPRTPRETTAHQGYPIRSLGLGSKSPAKRGRHGVSFSVWPESC